MSVNAKTKENKYPKNMMIVVETIINSIAIIIALNLLKIKSTNLICINSYFKKLTIKLFNNESQINLEALQSFLLTANCLNFKAA